MNLARLPALDGMRGLAAIGIVVFHAVLVCRFALVPWSGLVSWAHACVDLFFVLSGYLITRILLASPGGKMDFRGFYARRILRIFPAYFTVLLAIFLLLPWLSESFRTAQVRQELWMYALFIQNWDYAFNGWADWLFITHFWSLAVEEQFYLVWPLLIVLAGRQRLPAVCVGIFAVACVALIAVDLVGDPGRFASTSTLTRMGGLAAGAWVACVDRDALARHLRSPGGWLLGALLAYAVFVIWAPRQLPFDDAIATLFAALSPAVVVALIHTGKLPALANGVLAHPLLRWFGHYSYGLYLLHYPIIGLLLERLGPEISRAMAWSPSLTPLLFSALTFAISVPLAVAMFHAIEAPVLKLKPRPAITPPASIDGA